MEHSDTSYIKKQPESTQASEVEVSESETDSSPSSLQPLRLSPKSPNLHGTTALRQQQVMRLAQTIGNQATQRVIQRDRVAQASVTPSIIQRGIKPGDNLATMDPMLKNRFDTILKGEERYANPVAERDQVADAKLLLEDDVFFTTIFQKALQQQTAMLTKKNEMDSSKLPTETDKNEVRNYLRQALNDVTELLVSPLVKGLTDSKNGRNLIVVHFITDSKDFSKEERTKSKQSALKSQAKVALGGLDPDTPLTKEGLATAFKAQYGKIKIQQTFPDSKKVALATALKAMPFIRNLLKDKKAPAVDENVSRWRDDGNVGDDNNVTMQEVKRWSRSRFSKVPSKDDAVFKTKFVGRVAEAEHFIRSIVEARLLKNIPRPKIICHLDFSSGISAPNGFRAFCSEGEVHVAFDEKVEIIVHEIAHHVENWIPTENWLSIQKLMESRHEGAGGGAKAGGNILLSEGRYKGDYAYTGDYTSRAYDDSSTEMTSMTLEKLVNPKYALKMVEKDPLQTAIILKSLRPDEYDSTTQLRPFNRYLPHAPTRKRANVVRRHD